MKLAWFFSLLLLSVSLASCQHHDLCFHHEHEVKIRVEFDWRYANDAKPEGMAVFFYREGDSRAIRYDFPNRTGGEVSLPTGRYRIIAYNNDTEFTLFDNHHDFDAHMAYTRQGNVLEPVQPNNTAPSPINGETVVVCPDEIYGCTAIEVDITQDGISYICVPLDEADDYIGLPITTDEQVIVLFPQDMLCHYSYEVRNVDGLERVHQLCGSISGMSPSLKVSSQDLHTLPVTLPYASRITDDGRIVGEFLTFGHHEENEHPHRMEFYVWMKNGNNYILGRSSAATRSDEDRFNVTDQVHTAPNRRRVHIIIDGLKIPEEPDNPQDPGELYPSIDDWFEVNTDIDL